MVLLLLTGLTAIAAGMTQWLQAQFNDDRRRTDLSPIALPGGSTVEFKSFDSQTLGAPERYSVFLPPSFSKDPSAHIPSFTFSMASITMKPAGPWTAMAIFKMR